MDDERGDNLQEETSGDLEITREKTDYTELANARAKEAMDRLENIRFASKEARRKRAEKRARDNRGTIHLSDEVEMTPEMLAQAGQRYDEFGQPINDNVIYNEYGQPINPMTGQPMAPGQMGQMPGAMNNTMSPQMSPQFGQMPPQFGQMPNVQMAPGQIPTPQNGQIPPQMQGQMNGAPQMGVVTNLDGTIPIASLDPTSRPMRQVPTVVVQKPKKIRKGWLVAISLSAFVAVAAAVLAVLIAATTKPDAVARAVERITTGEAAEYTSVSGELDFEFNDNPAMKSLEVNLKGAIKTANLENTMTARLIADMQAGNKLGAEVSEVYLRGDGLYMKADKLGALIKGIEDATAKAAKDSEDKADNSDKANNSDSTDNSNSDNSNSSSNSNSNSNTNSNNSSTNSKTESAKVTDTLKSLISSNDGKWLHLSTNDTPTIGSTKIASCELSLLANLAANQATLASIYRTYPFISSTTKGVELESAEHPVYKVNLDINNLTSFFNGVESMKTLAAYEECKGMVTPAIVGSDVAKIFNNVNNIYVEVTEDFVITRLYFTYSADWGSLTADLYLSYPDTAGIAPPTDFTELSPAISDIIKK